MRRYFFSFKDEVLIFEGLKHIVWKGLTNSWLFFFPKGDEPFAKRWWPPKQHGSTLTNRSWGILVFRSQL